MILTMVFQRVAVLVLAATSSLAFTPLSLVKHGGLTKTAMNLVDQSIMMDAGVIETAATVMQQSSAQFGDLVSNFAASSSNTLAFADQGQNMAGIFFQASLLPYLLFLYFLQFRANRINNIGNFGFQFLLLFVLATIPSGIISKMTYGCSLADVDWLHGSAELLLTVSNILVVLGLKEASTNPSPPDIGVPRYLALGTFVIFAAFCALGPSLGFVAHSEFLLGLGDLPAETAFSLPWVTHAEPVNALSIPTWGIHFSSVVEYLVAMNLIWKYAEVTGNEKWKGLTWGMLPLHASGICACTYHFFYNPSTLQFLVTMQAGFTLLGNLTCALAAFRIAQSNGWNLDEVNPFPKSSTDQRGLVADGIAALPLTLAEPEESNQVLAAKVVGVTVFLSYLVKYGELGLDLPFEPNAPVALGMVLGIPAITAYQFYRKSEPVEEGEGGFSLNFLGDNNLSMDDVKKYGVAGTLAYVLTELAFWVVAFPVAATALYQSTGHWPDVVNETGDRAAVLGFIFAGANIARAFVPLRLGAALALAPWVDENLLSGDADADESRESE